MTESKNEFSKNDQESFEFNLVEFEKAFRELKCELNMKRNEVNKLKSEIEEAHHENHDLKVSLEKLKKTLQEQKITMEMFMKRSQDFEPKYYEKRDAYVKLELQYKMEDILLRTSKYTALREDFQKLAMEKSQLIRKVDVLEEKRKSDLMYSNDIMQKMNQLKNMIGVIKGDIQKVKEEQHHAASLSEQVNLVQEAAEKCQKLSDYIEKLKLEKDLLEKQFVKYKAKSEKLASFLSANNRIIDEENLEAAVLLAQCKKTSIHYRQQIQTKNEIIKTLNDTLCQEKEIHAKLIEDNENICQENTALKQIIRELEPNENGYEQKQEKEPELPQNMGIIKSENEPIEIIDSQ